MIKSFDRRKRPIRGAFISGSTIALLFAGCGGGDEKTTDIPPIKLDAALATGGTIAATGGSPPSLDATVATGGTMAMDASPDLMVVTSPDTAKVDTSLPDGGHTDTVPSTDSPIEVAGLDANAIDTRPKTDAGESPCPKPVLAQKLSSDGVVPRATSISWGINGNLLLGTELWQKGSFLSQPVNYIGSGDSFIANLLPSSTTKTFGPSWVFSAGDESEQSISRIATSSDNMTAIIGTFFGAMEFGAKQISNPSATERAYIAGLKIADGTGAWAKSVDLGGEQFYAIAGNPKQNFFLVCGAAKNAAPSLVTAGSNKGGTDIVVAAIKASDGTVIWSKLFGGTGNDTCSAAALDDAGNAYFAGTFSSALDLGTGPLAFAPLAADAGSTDTSSSLWVTKLGVTGESLAAASFGTTPGLKVLHLATSGKVGMSLTTDSQGNVVVAGTFRNGNLAFGNTILTPMGLDTFIAKLNSELQPTWARRWGMANPGEAESKGIATTSNGDVIAIGAFRGTIEFGPGANTLTSFASPSLGATDISIVRLVGASGVTACALQYGSPPPPAGSVSTSNGREVLSISINRWASGELLDQIAVSGYLTDTTLDFGSGTAPLASEAYKDPNSVAGMDSVIHPVSSFLLKMQP